jgi:hypothetical protein
MFVGLLDLLSETLERNNIEGENDKEKDTYALKKDIVSTGADPGKTAKAPLVSPLWHHGVILPN